MKLKLTVIILLSFPLLFAVNTTKDIMLSFHPMLKMNEKLFLKRNHLDLFFYHSIQPIEINDTLIFAYSNYYEGRFYDLNKNQVIFFNNKCLSIPDDRLCKLDTLNLSRDSESTKPLGDSLALNQSIIQSGYNYHGIVNQFEIYFSEYLGEIQLSNLKDNIITSFKITDLAKINNIQSLRFPHGENSYYRVFVTNKYVYLFFQTVYGTVYCYRSNLTFKED